ncbi:MAG: ABC transporter substrate-binding protein, partial [Thermaerobacter sp.]|nr:ABC transporter substrate-binding protein [Thermaerobacter sp.]
MRFALKMTSAALISTVVLAGCGSSPATPGSSPTTVTGGTAVVAMAPQSSPNWFFPVFSGAAYTEINSQIQFLMYRPLIYLDRQSHVDYSKSLAKSIQVNSTGTRYMITLGKKYRWSNGQPVTAQDVVFTWNLIKGATQPNAPWAYGAMGSGGVPADWSSVTAENPSTVVVTLTHSANPQWFIHNGLSQLSPVPAAVWNKYPNSMTQELKFIQSVSNSPTNPAYRVVDGPFRFQSWQPNNFWSLVPNPQYGGHKASIAKLTFLYQTSSSNEFAGLKTGTINVGYLPPSMWKARTQLTGEVRSAAYLVGMNYLVVNMNPKAQGGVGPLLAKLYVRQALQMGIDQKGIIQSLYHGYGVATDGPIPSQPLTSFYDPALNSPPYPFNPSQGKKLLQRGAPQNCDHAAMRLWTGTSWAQGCCAQRLSQRWERCKARSVA